MQQTLMERQKKESSASLSFSAAWHFMKPPTFLLSAILKVQEEILREFEAETLLVSINVIQLQAYFFFTLLCWRRAQQGAQVS